jgi:hypothetical protein
MDAVPETFVDAVGEISFKYGVVRIDLLSLSGPEPRVTQRLITSLQAFQQILQAHNGMIEQLEKAGVIRPTASQPAPHPDPPPQAGEGEAKEGGGVAAAVRRLVRMEPVPLPAAVAAPPSEPALQLANLGPPRSPNFSDEQ